MTADGTGTRTASGAPVPPPAPAAQSVHASGGSRVENVTQQLHYNVVVQVGGGEVVVTGEQFRRAALAEVIGIAVAVTAIWVTTRFAPLSASYGDILLYTLLAILALAAVGGVRCWRTGKWNFLWLSPLTAVPLLLVIWWIF